MRRAKELTLNSWAKIEVTFLRWEPRRTPFHDNLECTFRFSVIDAALIGTPRDVPSTHIVTIVLTDELMDHWRLSGAFYGGVSDDLLKVVFQVAEEYITEQLKRDGLQERELPRLALSTKNSPLSLPYNLANIPYPGQTTFTVDILTSTDTATGRDFDPREQASEGAKSAAGKYYSCFFSYSSKDKTFANKLHADLQDRGVEEWFAPEDLPIGARTRVALDESILEHHKLLLILSQYSVASDWVEQEVETALEKERDTNSLVLFPIRIDDAVMALKTGWAAHVRRTRHIGDFRNWKDHKEYQKAMGKLLRDLKAGN